MCIVVKYFIMFSLTCAWTHMFASYHWTCYISTAALASLNCERSILFNIFLNHLSDAGSPWRNAFPHYVCPEHGAHPVPALAPQPRRAGAGPRAPAAPRCQRRRASQLRTSDSGLNINCGDHQEASTKIIPTWKCMGNSVYYTTEFLFLICGKSHSRCTER